MNARPIPAEHSHQARMATSISVAVCKCGCCSVVVRFHDEAGEIFAAGSMSPETAVEFNEQLCTTVEGAVRDLVSTRGGVH